MIWGKERVCVCARRMVEGVRELGGMEAEMCVCVKEKEREKLRERGRGSGKEMIHYRNWVHEFMGAENPHNPLSTSWITKKAGDIIQP